MSIGDTVAKVVIRYDADTSGAQRAVEQLSQAEQRANKTRKDGMDEASKSAEYLGNKIEGIGKQIAQQKIGEFTRLASGYVSDLTGGVVDLNSAVLGAQAFGPAGAVIGAFGKSALEAAHDLLTMGDSIQAVSDRATLRATPEFQQMGGIMGKLRDSAKETGVALAQSFYGLDFSKLNEQIQRLDRSWAGMALTISSSVSSISKFTIAANTAAGIAGFAGLDPVLKTANQQLSEQKSVLDRLHGPQVQYHKDVDALNRLLATGQITSHEFTAELHRLGSGLDHVATSAAHAKKAFEGSSFLARLDVAAAIRGSGIGAQLEAFHGKAAIRGGAGQAISSDFPSLDALTSGNVGGAGAVQKTIPERLFGQVSEIDMYRESWGALTSSVTAGYSAMIDGTESFGQAFKHALADSLKSMGSRMLIRSLEELAEGFSSLAHPLGGPAAVLHFKSSAMFAAASVAAGVASHALGSGGGGGNSSASAGSAGSSGGGSRGQGNQPQGQTVIVYGDSFADDSPRNRQIRAQRVVSLALGGGQGVVFA